MNCEMGSRFGAGARMMIRATAVDAQRHCALTRDVEYPGGQSDFDYSRR